jgi:hypothetical protein
MHLVSSRKMKFPSFSLLMLLYLNGNVIDIVESCASHLSIYNAKTYSIKIIFYTRLYIIVRKTSFINNHSINSLRLLCSKWLTIFFGLITVVNMFSLVFCCRIIVKAGCLEDFPLLIKIGELVINILSCSLSRYRC